MVNVKKVELLAPAGNMECLKAAIEAGCDAVYLAGKLFGARSFAGNFSDEELVEAIKYSHLYGVKVYLTINTIIYEREVEHFINYVRFVHQNNVDAVIIQDLGMMGLIRKKFPNLEVHASTQMHIHNFEGALFAKQMGIKRIVMARETSLEVTRRIKKELDIEVELFVHGALCVSYSGQCLMSSLIGGRSGNRGTCTQSCRKAYNIYDEQGNKLNVNDYLLSTKDLCTLEYLDKIINSGVDSLKIEGRMKRPEYVYLVTSIYRKTIDNYYKYGDLKIDKRDIIELKKMFNREFTKGFMLGEENDRYVSQERPNHRGIVAGRVVSCNDGYLKIKLDTNVSAKDGFRIIDKEDKGLVISKMYLKEKSVNEAKIGDVITIKYDKKVTIDSLVLLTTDSKQIKTIDERLNKKNRSILVNMTIKANLGKKLLVSITDQVNEVSCESDFIIDKAISNPITKDVIIKQMSKTGDTVYEVKNIGVHVDEDIFINIRDLNDIRRRLLKELDQKRLYKITFIERDYEMDVPDFKSVKQTSVLISNEEDLEKLSNNFDVIHVDKPSMLKDGYILKLPRIVNHYEKIDEKVMIGEVGGLTCYKNFDTDFSFNVVNSYTVAFLHVHGAEKVTLSHELTTEQIKRLIEGYHERYNKHPNLEVINEGYAEAMICKFDLNKMNNIKVGYLEDEFNNKFKIVSKEDFMTIYNYKKIKTEDANNYHDVGVNFVRINL